MSLISCCLPFRCCQPSTAASPSPETIKTVTKYKVTTVVPAALVPKEREAKLIIKQIIPILTVTASIPLVLGDIIANYLIEREQEVATYQEFLSEIKNEDKILQDKAYKNLAKLIQAGYSTAPLALLNLEIPDFFSRLALSINCETISFTTARPLERVELLNHISVIRRILTHSALSKDLKREKIQTLEGMIGVPSDDSINGLTRTGHFFTVIADKSNPNLTKDLWKDMIELLYPASLYETKCLVAISEVPLTEQQLLTTKILLVANKIRQS